MAICTTVLSDRLDGLLTLSPERHDPRKAQNNDGLLLHECVAISSKIEAAGVGEYVVLDTSDSLNGYITIDARQRATSLRSAKKTLQPGDVIISRLRPYLRQVGYVDEVLVQHANGTTLCCSTEYFVLRAAPCESAAFLVPFLLSDRIQAILKLSQEGGHHPRFNLEVLRSLRIPSRIVKERAAISERVIAAIAAKRHSDLHLAEVWQDVNATMVTSTSSW
jgi:hypothetical protein